MVCTHDSGVIMWILTGEMILSRIKQVLGDGFELR